MPIGAIARAKRRAEEAAAAAAAAKGPEPMLTVRLAEVPFDADLSPLTAEAYPVEGFPFEDTAEPKIRKKSGPKPRPLTKKEEVSDAQEG
jgi:hypothetical protein